MLQTVLTPVERSWSASIFNSSAKQTKSSQRSGRDQKAAAPSVADVAQLYPNAVVASSDALAWQNVRVFQLRHSLNEIVVPASDQHCIVLNLSGPLQLKQE